MKNNLVFDDGKKIYGRIKNNKALGISKPLNIHTKDTP